MRMVGHGESGVLRGTSPIPNPGRRIKRTHGLERVPRKKRTKNPTLAPRTSWYKYTGCDF